MDLRGDRQDECTYLFSTFQLFPQFQFKACEVWSQTVLGRDCPPALSVRESLAIGAHLT
jgi:hypothetical protein